MLYGCRSVPRDHETEVGFRTKKLECAVDGTTCEDAGFWRIQMLPCSHGRLLAFLFVREIMADVLDCPKIRVVV